MLVAFASGNLSVSFMTRVFQVANDVRHNISEVSLRYALALYSVGADRQELDAIIDNMRTIRGLIDGHAELRLVLKNHLINANSLQQALSDILARYKITGTAANLIGTIIANRRTSQLTEIINAFLDLVSRRRGQIRVDVTSAHILSDGQRTQLQARLTEIGYPKVEVVERTDPTLLGGLRVQIGSKLYDTSIKTQLQRMQFALKGAA